MYDSLARLLAMSNGLFRNLFYSLLKYLKLKGSITNHSNIDMKLTYS